MPSFLTSNVLSEWTAGIGRQLSMGHGDEVDIHIDGHFSNKVYTSLSKVSGHVTVQASKDVRYHHFHIALLGTTKTRVDGSMSATNTTHAFLQLHMPTPEHCHPEPRVFQENYTYTFPFEFVIPRHLTVDVCHHKTSGGAVQEHHLHLPPSMGHWPRDDMSPQMAQVDYEIVARALGSRDAVGTLRRLLGTGRRILVLPAFPEQPPLGLLALDQLYTPSKSKRTRNFLFLPQTGQLSATAEQPPAVLLAADGHTASRSQVRVDVRFDPASSQVSSPPRLLRVASKVTAVTFFSAEGIPHLPDQGAWLQMDRAHGRGVYRRTITLDDVLVKEEEEGWQRHHQARAPRDPASLPEERPGPSPGSEPPDGPSPYFTASLQLPVELPVPKKMFLPTFHSCITSRVYVLSLGIVTSSSIKTTTIWLDLPLQVAVQPPALPWRESELPTFEVAIGTAPHLQV